MSKTPPDRSVKGRFEYAIGVYGDGSLKPDAPTDDAQVIDQSRIDEFEDHVYRRAVGPWERVK